MPEFKRKQRRFATHGMNWATPLDSIPDDQFALILNLRSYTNGDLLVRPGLETVGTISPTGSTDYLHSISSVLDFNPDTSEGAARFLGFNQTLQWQDGIGLTGATFSLVSSGWSGNPQTHTPFTPTNSPVPFVYVWDSTKQRKYSPEYQTVPGTPDEFAIGLPSFYAQYVPIPSSAGAGNLNGVYNYRWVFRDRIRGTTSVPGPASFDATFTNEEVTIVSPNPGGLSADFVYDLYRFSSNVPQWKLVGSVATFTSITDNLSDLDIVAAQTLLTDPADLKFQPFVTPDIDRQGVVTVGAATSTDGSSIAVTSGDAFNLEWVIGTEIVVSGIACHLRRFSAGGSTAYLEEDIGALGGGQTYSVTGALQAGKPLGRVWGPFGAGQFGLTFFACGDERAPGTLYWLNGNDPDSISLINSLEVSSPSDPLQNGCMWNARAFVWSSARLWEIIPTTTQEGRLTFTTNSIANAHGLFAPWCFCVGDKIYWMSQDGGWSYDGSLPVSITDEQLYTFLPHDGKNGFDVILPNPENVSAPLTFHTPDPTEPHTWRMCWVDGLIYFDYKEFGSNNAYTLVYDTHLMKGGWSLDVYATTGLNSDGFISRYYETALAPDNSSAPLREHLVGIASTLYWTNNITDSGTPITYSLMTGADMMGDIRAPKQIGDVVVGATTNSQTPTVRILQDTNSIVTKTATLAALGNYQQTIISVSDKLNLYKSRTWGVWFYGTSSSTLKLTDYEISYLPEPEVITTRPTDWTDDGYMGDKFLMGVVIDSYIASGDPTAVSIQMGGASTIVTITLAVGRVEAAYSFIPVVAKQFRVAPESFKGQIFSIRYIWEKYPEYLGLQEDYDTQRWPSDKYIRGVAIEGDTKNLLVNINVYADGAAWTNLPVTQNGKTLSYFAFGAPIVAREIKLIPLGPWRKHSVRWIYDEYPDYAALLTPWTEPAEPMYMRGGRVTCDTRGVDVTAALWVDGVFSGVSKGFNTNGQQTVEIAFNPPIVGKQIRWAPNLPWSYWTTHIDGETYPYLINERTAVLSPGGVGAKYMRGAILTCDTNGLGVSYNFLYDGPLAGPSTPTLTFTGKSSQPVAFTTPFIAHNIQIVPSANSRIFPDECQWIFDPYPELAPIKSKVFSPGGGHAIFVQGVRIPADSSNSAVVYSVSYDGGQAGPTLASTSWNGKQVIPFSFNPFIAHTLQLTPNAAVRTFEEEVEWIYEPAPELARVWETQYTNHDIPEWHSLAFAYIAYQSSPGSAGSETLTITTDSGVAFTYSLPVSTIYTRAFIRLHPQKARTRKYRIDSTLGVRLFVRDCAIGVQPWGNIKSILPKQPFGDLSRDMGAKI